MIGSFAKSMRGVFIYKNGNTYSLYRAQGMSHICDLPDTINIWQSQLYIWLMATGRIIEDTIVESAKKSKPLSREESEELWSKLNLQQEGTIDPNFWSNYYKALGLEKNA